MSSAAPSRILGIDPGSRTTGWGIIDTAANGHRHVAHGHINVTGDDLAARLHCIHTAITDVIAEYAPGEAAIENVFVHRNAGSALKLGQARGAAVTAVAGAGLALHEYAPTAVKQALVGRGHADKAQVAHMVKVLLALSEAVQADAADALAIAVCHSHMREGLARIPGVRRVSGGRLR